MNFAAREAQSVGDHISERNFDRLARFIYDYSGIKMPQNKLTMLEGRLRRRLRATHFVTFDDYCNFLFNENGMEQEAVYLIDVMTTNKTDFFRESKHFDFMRDVALPALVSKGHGNLRLWSSACSIGAEPYTMAMVAADFMEHRSSLDFSILATDLSTEVLQTAQQGIYPRDMVAPVPAELRRKYVMMPTKADRPDVRIVPKLRAKIGFGRLNLMDDKYSVGYAMHMIFCRNVLIYFDKTTRLAVMKRLCDCLEPGGYLYIGHSESITGFDLPLQQVSNTVFLRS